MALFTGLYGISRFLSDTLRVNDERVLGLTGAQYLCLALLPTSAWIFFRVRGTLAQDQADGMVPGLEPAPAPAADGALGADETGTEAAEATEGSGDRPN
jgi:hypothetical protein